MRYGLVLVLLLGACHLPSFPDAFEPWMVTEFGIAQQRVFNQFSDPRIWEVTPDMFSVQELKPIGVNELGVPYIMCGETPAHGCYLEGPKHITWVSSAPNVLRHEYGHGIMHVLKLKKGECNWRTWEHLTGCGK
jgi:hypothetical protein